MKGYLVTDERKITSHRFLEMKHRGEKISMLTAYDYTTAGILDRSGVDALLIGAGNGCDGQVLVYADMLGLTQGFSPRFLRRYADLNTIITEAVGRYVTDVKSGDFPSEQESY